MSMTREPNNLSSPPPPQPPNRYPPASNIQLPPMSSLLGHEAPTRVEYNTSPYPPQPPQSQHFVDADRSISRSYNQRPPEYVDPRYQPNAATTTPAPPQHISVNPIQYEGPTAQRRQPKRPVQRKADPARQQAGQKSSMALESRREGPSSGIKAADRDSAMRSVPYNTGPAQPSKLPVAPPQDVAQNAVPISNLLSTTSEINRPTTKYTLVIRQQPESARACGYGERDRRVVDPPPILTLEIEEPHGRPETYVVHCVLWNAETNTDATAMPESNERRQQRRLMGTNVASPFPAKDENNVEKIFFTFPDVSVRTPGTYRLKFNLCVMDLLLQGPGAKNPVTSTVMSAPFQVFNAKDFGGMQASSALTKSLKAQGCLIPVKKGNTRANASNARNRNNEEEEEEDEEDDRMEE